ncbi:MAG: glycosyltransferase family 2 protein [Mucilaginibacter polytrichastri]|nr:glycosyltransferase family 2 protein [Mucilaginibacter polytrichastri]
MSEPRVAIVILNWNGKQHLEQFLPSVLGSTYTNYEVVVGDNASTDGSVEFLQKNYPQIRLVINEENYGFTGGYNRVLEQVDADYFVLLNSDVEVTPGWIEPVISLLESQSHAAAAMPRIRSYHHRDAFEHAGAAGGYIDRFGFPFCRGRIFFEVEKDEGQYNQSGEVFWATGTALFIKKKFWVASGGFDERFFAHMEEIDLCWRLKNMGLCIFYCAESVVYHVGGGSLSYENPFKTYLNFRNNLLMISNNLSPLRAGALILSRLLFFDAIAFVRFLSEGKRKDASAVARAHRNFLRSLFKGRAKTPKAEGRNAKPYSLTLKHRGVYAGSVVWAFFVSKKHKWTQLKRTYYKPLNQS